MAEEIAGINRLLSASKKNPALITLEATVMHGFERQALDECIDKCQPFDIVRGNGRIFFNISAHNYEKSLRLQAVDNLFLVCHTFKHFRSCRNSGADLVMFKELAKSVPWRKYVDLWFELTGSVTGQFHSRVSARKLCKEQGSKDQRKFCSEQGENQAVNIQQPVNNIIVEESRVIRKLDFLFQEALIRIHRYQRPINPAELKETARRKIVAELENLALSLHCPLTYNELSLISTLLDTVVDSRNDNILNLTNNNEPFGPNFGLDYPPKSKSDVEIYSELDDLVHKTINSVFSVELSDVERADSSSRRSFSSSQPQGSQKNSTLSVSPGPSSPSLHSYDSDEESAAKNCGALLNTPRLRKNSSKEDFFESLKCKITLCSNDRLSCSFPNAASAMGNVLTELFGWQVDSSNYDFNIFFVFDHGSGFVTLSLTRARRSVVDYGMNTLGASLCYNLVRIANPQPGDLILDPMCGSCSISIEGARAFPATFHIGGDLNERALLRTKNNIQHINRKYESAKIDAFRWNVKRGLPFRSGVIDIVITDLPTGLGNKNNVPLYTVTLKQLALVTKKGTGRAVIFTSDLTAFSKALDANNQLWEEVNIFEVFQKNYFSKVCLLRRKCEK